MTAYSNMAVHLSIPYCKIFTSGYIAPMSKNNDQFNERQRKAARPRAFKMLRMREQNKTWREIGEAFGVTAQRAQALVKAHAE